MLRTKSINEVTPDIAGHDDVWKTQSSDFYGVLKQALISSGLTSIIDKKSQGETDLSSTVAGVLSGCVYHTSPIGTGQETELRGGFPDDQFVKLVEIFIIAQAKSTIELNRCAHPATR